MKTVPVMYALIAAASLWPLVRATLHTAGTAFVHAVAWAWLAWASWVACLGYGTAEACYVALSATACAGVAVLGARRPGVGAWHAVVAGLFVVLLLPMAEGFLTSTTAVVSWPRTTFVAAVLAVGIGNYLPTRFRVGAAVLAVACTCALFSLTSPGQVLVTRIAAALAVCSPLVAATTSGRRQYANDYDRTWTEFRDRYGAVWAHRVREQFNAAARHAGLAVELTWYGGRGLSSENQATAETLLAALIRRFGV